MQKLGGISNSTTRAGRATTAAAEFWRASADLVGGRDPSAAAEQAAEAILELAALDARETLQEILRPDLDDDSVTWTVACFEVGSVAPAGLHEVHDPVDAIAVLVSCDERAHVASELACTGPDGLQWIALNRTQHRTSFRLPGLENMTAPDATIAAAAVARWRRQVQVNEAFADESESAVVDLRESSPAPAPSVASGPTPRSSRTPGPVDGSSEHAAARRLLRRNVASGRAVDARNPTKLDTAEIPITTRTLHGAMRNAVAEVIPHLEQYLLDAVALAVAESRLEDRQEIIDIRNRVTSLPGMVGADLQSRLDRDDSGRRSALPQQVARTVRETVEHSLRDTEAVIQERIGRLSALVDTLSNRQTELRTSFTTLRGVEDKVDTRIDRLDGHLDSLESRLESAISQLRSDQAVLQNTVRQQATEDTVTLLRRELATLRDEVRRQPILENLELLRHEHETTRAHTADAVDAIATSTAAAVASGIDQAVQTMAATVERQHAELTAGINATLGADRSTQADHRADLESALMGCVAELRRSDAQGRTDTAAIVTQVLDELRSAVSDLGSGAPRAVADSEDRLARDHLRPLAESMQRSMRADIDELRAAVAALPTGDDLDAVRCAIEQRPTAPDNAGETRLALWEIREEQQQQRAAIEAAIRFVHSGATDPVAHQSGLDRHEHLRTSLEELHDQQRQLRSELSGRLTEAVAQLRADQDDMRNTLPAPIEHALRQLRVESEQLRGCLVERPNSDVLESLAAEQSRLRAAIRRPAPGGPAEASATPDDLAIEVQGLRDDVARVGRMLQSLRTSLLG